MYREKLNAYIDSHMEDLLEDLKQLVSIDSQRTESLPGKPYGEGPAMAISAAEKLLSSYGFQTKNYDNRVVTGDFNEKEKKLDILAHLDVVPVSKDWTVTAPFEPVVVDGKIYGRGTADDKGPAIAALYAMRAIRDLGIELDYNVRLILGSDEECGSTDLEYYYQIEEEAPMSFTPDADYPVINIEKGRFAKNFEAEFEEKDEYPKIMRIQGGDKVNVVPADAWAEVAGLTKEILLEAAGKTDIKTGVKFIISEGETRIKITAKGVAGHASTPEVGNNALTALLTLLAGLPFAECPGFDKVKALHQLFGHNDFGGEGLGIDMEDEISGKLTMNLGVLSYEQGNMTGQFDSRVPICGTEENVTQPVKKRMNEAGFCMEDTAMIPPHYVSADSELVQTLLETYEDYMGKKGKPLAIGGGTYVHELERGVAFGCMTEDVDNHMHGDNEFMTVEMLSKSAKMFADAIVKLCRRSE